MSNMRMVATTVLRQKKHFSPTACSAQSEQSAKCPQGTSACVHGAAMQMTQSSAALLASGSAGAASAAGAAADALPSTAPSAPDVKCRQSASKASARPAVVYVEFTLSSVTGVAPSPPDTA